MGCSLGEFATDLSVSRLQQRCRETGRVTWGQKYGLCWCLQHFIERTGHTCLVQSLYDCILDIKLWMEKGFLLLIQDKTNILLIGPEDQREKLKISLNGLALNLKKSSKRTQTWVLLLSSKLSSRLHPMTFKNISRIRSFLSWVNTETLVLAFITSRLDYCNAPKKNIAQLQLLQNSAASKQTKTRWYILYRF